MAGKREMARETEAVAGRDRSCPECDSENNTNIRKNKDQIADCLLRICAIINGTWNDILASLQTVSFLREMALYIDCNILAIWKNRRAKTNKEKKND
jgi:hypothetical protein